MKKLMIAAAIVCAAAMSQAASLDWTTWGYSLSGGTTGDEVWEGNGAAYLVMVTDAANFAVADDLTITGGTVVDSGINDGAGTLSHSWNTTLEAGQKYLFAIVATTAGTGAKNTDGYIMPTTGYYGVDRNGGNSTESGFYEAEWNADTGAAFIAFEGTEAHDFEDAYYGVSMSTAVGAVPEPTSGLLLLLGVAGLALRRRRA